MYFFVQTNHTRKELLFLMFLKINLRNNSSLHKLFYSLEFVLTPHLWSFAFAPINILNLIHTKFNILSVL
ncbi:hypothetical protein DM476_08795 [Lactobacillus helveticus]|nr:hypothetical protein DM476_08795 [Lactobacillus helveticus]